MKMTCILKLSALGLFGSVGATGAENESLPVPADEFVYCTVCHGVQLIGNFIIEAPRLSEMESWYVERQLRAFKNGWRGTHDSDANGLEMRPMAATLSDEQIAEVAVYVNATRSELPPQTMVGDAENGEALYHSCAACHGAGAEGNLSLGAPALRGLNDWYLVRQMNNYRNGTRGGVSTDTYGVQMAAASALLEDDAAVRDVVNYITNLPTN